MACVVTLCDMKPIQSPAGPESGESENPKAHDPDQFVDLYGDYLFSYAMSRVQNASLAEDLVQETLLKAIVKLDSFRGDASIRTWMVTILRNEMFSHYRKKKTVEKHMSECEDSSTNLGKLLHPDISNDDFSTAIEREEFWKIIQDCYSRIPEHLLDVFLTKMESDGQSIEDLSNELGISASNFSVRMFRTRLLLRKCIESKWAHAE